MKLKFSQKYLRGLTQAEVDFVDIDLETDITVFIDPRAIASAGTQWSVWTHEVAHDFFQTVLDQLREDDTLAAAELMSHLHEDNRTRLGYSRGTPQGRGLGDGQAALFIAALRESDAFRSGRIHDVEDTALFVDRLDCDIISDMLTNVLREPLAMYTQEQCELHGIPLTVHDSFLAWRPGEGWIKVTVELPSHDGRPILLVPRSIVRRHLSLRPDVYLRAFFDAVDSGDPSATRSLEEMLQQIPKKGKRRKSVHRAATKDQLRALGSRKAVIAKLDQSSPDVLEDLKRKASNNGGVLTPSQLNSAHSVPAKQAAAESAAENRAAAAKAEEIHDLMAEAVATAIAAFHPFLQHPRLLDMAVDGLRGTTFSNVAPEGPLWAKAANVVLFASDEPITGTILRHVDVQALRENVQVGQILLVGDEIDKAVRRRRREFADDNVIILSIHELAAIAEINRGPAVACEALKELLAA